MSQKPQATAGAASEVDELVRRLGEVRDAITHARDLGIPAAVPEVLYRACLALVEMRDGPRGGGQTTSAGSFAHSMPTQPVEDLDIATIAPRLPVDDLIGKVPLRQVLWEVITPGEEFTVADVADRLDQRGVSWPANKVSNALGYWVSRARLDRCRKGVYRYPDDPIADEFIGDDNRRDSPTGLTSRATKPAGGEEIHSHVPPKETRQAM